jgi:hypothetical protein
MSNQSDCSTEYIDIGEMYSAYRGRRAGRECKGFLGTWEILSFPSRTYRKGNRWNNLPRPW